MIKKIAVITPIKHLKLNKLIELKGKVFYLENSKKNEVRKMLLKESINTILCNPNKQTFKIDKDLLQGTRVNLINTCSTGLSHIDMDYCREAKITVYSLTNDYELINDLPSTSELAFGLMIDMLRSITSSQKDVKMFKWDYTKFIGRQIKDLTIGIIGYGRLGKLMYNYCKAFQAKTLVYDPYIDKFSKKNLDEFIELCDVISIHVHLNNETKKMINRNSLSKSKTNLIIVNTSRGGVVDELDIISLLKNKKIGGYATDVLESENGDIKSSPLINEMKKNNKIIITPHVGGMTIEGQTKAYKWAINKL